ncbi:9986_t:CDS:2, partial [Gigaspora margarita]
EYNSKKLHDYYKKPEIKHKNSSVSTYRYAIISEGYYLSPPTLIEYDKDGPQTIESLQSATHAANLFAQTYNINIVWNNSILVVTQNVEQARDAYCQSNFLRPLETL